MVTAFIGIGSNLGDRLSNINKAIAYLESCQQVQLKKISKFIETLPSGGPPQPRYINGVLKIKTSLSASLLLKLLQSIEKRLGRERRVRFGPRTIDLDILLYGDCVIEDEDLSIPHPRMFQRPFVMQPLKEIEPDIEKIIHSLKCKMQH